ncbi:MAG: rhodanese-like domain-containing protein [Opitutales bacterium]
MSHQSAPASELERILREGHTLIDVRTPAEYRAEHVSGAESQPLSELNPSVFRGDRTADKPIYILCQSGKRAIIAAERLTAAGCPAPVVIEGGTDAAKTAGIDIVRGNGAISIERQVRIAAGMLVAIGSIAGLVIHAGFFILPIFVGSGLVFAGLTDTCGMGLLLAKMPWNR